MDQVEELQTIVSGHICDISELQVKFDKLREELNVTNKKVEVVEEMVMDVLKMRAMAARRQTSIKEMKTLGWFVTFHRKKKPFGKVEEDFWNDFKDELGGIWTLIDEKENKHELKCEVIREEALLTDGWGFLRNFYGMTGDHSIMFRYVKFDKLREELNVTNKKVEVVEEMVMDVLKMPFGKVEEDFWNDFKDELGGIWTLIDEKENKHELKCEVIREEALLTDGWGFLRNFYGMTGDHSIMFRYVGLRLFDITVWRKPSNLKSIDEAANPSRSSRNPKPVTPSESRSPTYTKKVFKVVLTENKATGRQLSLPVDFGDHLRTSPLRNTYLKLSFGPQPTRRLRVCPLTAPKPPKHPPKVKPPKSPCPPPKSSPKPPYVPKPPFVKPPHVHPPYVPNPPHYPKPPVHPHPPHYPKPPVHPHPPHYPKPPVHPHPPHYPKPPVHPHPPHYPKPPVYPHPPYVPKPPVVNPPYVPKPPPHVPKPPYVPKPPVVTPPYVPKPPVVTPPYVPKPPVVTPPYVPKPPVVPVTPPYVPKPPVVPVTPPYVPKPPIVYPPVVPVPPVVPTPPIVKPPIVYPPVVPVPPIVTPPIVKPPIVYPPVVPKPPIVTPPVVTPPSPPSETPCPPPPPPAQPTCPIDTLKLGACVDVLGGLIHIGIGSSAKQTCCPVLAGLVDLDAAVCLCTTIRAKVLNINIIIPIALQVLIDCGKTPPDGFKCADS
uniref:14 kDa proline-rich protein DC2.15 n=1 Tax=Cajanus cajan TaxID=3821 RepID=A0A151R560_CAJCA|nr:14 kDa proline-rich protein DC2.15 [Cajanus cajan]